MTAERMTTTERMTAERMEDIRQIFPNRIDKDLARRIERMLNGSVTFVIDFAMTLVDDMDATLSRMIYSSEHLEEHLDSIRNELDNLTVFHKLIYEHINKLEHAINASRILVAYAPIDSSSLTPSSYTTPSSGMEHKHFERTLNLLGTTLCTVLPYMYQHTAIKPMCPASFDVFLANWLLRTTIQMDFVNDDAVRFHRSFYVPTEMSMYKSLIFRIKADNYAKTMYTRMWDKYTRMCAALTIQHAWFRYAYSPRTGVGQRRMLDTIEDLRATLS